MLYSRRHQIHTIYNQKAYQKIGRKNKPKNMRLVINTIFSHKSIVYFIH